MKGIKGMSPLWPRVIVLAAAFNLLSCGGGSGGGGGSPAKLDTAFGNAGIVTTQIRTIDDTINAMAIQSDGKLVAAGYSYNNTTGAYEFAVVRYNTDGTLDTTFNPTGTIPGVVTTAIGIVEDIAYALVIQPDDKLVAAGYSFDGTQNVFALVRYNPDGTQDAGFGSGGIVTTPIGSVDDTAYALAIQPSDDKLVAVGYSDNGSQRVFAVVRYNTNGTLDSGFDTDGIVTTAIGAIDDIAYALVIQPSDDKLVAAGYSDNGSQREFALVRYNTNGTLDSGFDTDGIVTTTIVDEDTAYALAIQPSDNRLVAAGYSFDGSQNVFALVRYNTDGSPDTAGFGSGGIVTTALGTIDDKVFALAVQPDDKVVAAGYSDDGTQRKFALTRYDTTGSLDKTFNRTGKIITTVAGDDVANAVAIQSSDSKLVAAGKSFNNTTVAYEFALVRYMPIP